MRATAHKSTRVLVALALGAAGVFLTGSPASAQSVSIDLCAEAGTLPLPDGASAPVWGFARAALDSGGTPTCTGVAAQVPGPVLDIPAGELVHVVVHNDLDVAVAVRAPRQASAGGAGAGAPRRAPAHS